MVTIYEPSVDADLLAALKKAVEYLVLSGSAPMIVAQGQIAIQKAEKPNG